MESLTKRREHITAVWDDEHIKALLHFPRFPARLIQQEPWQSWIGQRGGLKAVHLYLQNYPFSPSHRRILDVVLSTPEAVADVYADQLSISRATYFYQLRELVPAIAQALNHWYPNPVDIPPEDPIAFQTNIPNPLTSLVGAETTLQTLLRLFIREDVRLLTLLGPGGIGKTRMSIEIARRLDREVCFVDLSTLTDPSRLCAAIAINLGLKEATVSSLKKALRNRDFLLILDNFEQILPSRALVSDLLTSSPRLKVIVTSRANLQIYGEYEFTIPPLAIADIETVKGQQLWAQSPAVTLFVQRAQAVNPNFSLNNENVEAVTELCQRMEGLPLAIELAAYQVKYYSPQVVLNLSDHRLDFLSQGSQRVSPHHQTLRAILDWSFDLLTPDAQNLLCRLSVFPESFTMEEAFSIGMENVETGLTSLIDQSLLEQKSGADGRTKFKMLGIVREYALEKAGQFQLTS
ncbi:MAG TPA: AAA family ATPase [Anaerolineales bacterium]|nr:AAA family ATPase [Anaerolineales bacterium]